MASRLALFAPLFIFAVLALFLFRGLSLDPKELPSALVGQEFPAFQLDDLTGKQTRSRNDFPAQPLLVNVWATWCPSCLHEHPYLLQLAKQGVPIIGLNYKDEDVAALRWLKELGDPYQFNIADREGTLGVDLGVYGAPETYIVDGGGVVRYRHVGVVDEKVWSETLAPIYRELQGR